MPKGGKREGSGRKARPLTTKVVFALRLDPDTAAWANKNRQYLQELITVCKEHADHCNEDPSVSDTI